MFSPHDLRHRRISLLNHQGMSWAEIGQRIGQKKLSLTADTYTHVVVDGGEVDYGRLLDPVHAPVHAHHAHSGQACA